MVGTTRITAITPSPLASSLSASHPLLAPAVDAVSAAVTVCRAVQARQGAAACLKNDRSPVTVADFASQAVVVHALQRALGPVSLLAEEDAASLSALDDGYGDRIVEVVRTVWPEATPQAVVDAIAAGTGEPDAAAFWTLDPVDGTRGFLRGQQYAISLAYVREGRPSVAVLACPNLSADWHAHPETAAGSGVLCVAVEGCGAFELPLGDAAAVPRRLVVSGEIADPPTRVCTSVERLHGNASLLDDMLRMAAVTEAPIRLDSQCKYAVVAREQAAAYVRVPSSPDYAEWIWDHAAGALIASEAGCRVTDLFGRAFDMRTGRRLERNRGVLCATAAWHARLLEAVHLAGLADPLA